MLDGGKVLPSLVKNHLKNKMSFTKSRHHICNLPGAALVNWQNNNGGQTCARGTEGHNRNVNVNVLENVKG